MGSFCGWKVFGVEICVKHISRVGFFPQTYRLTYTQEESLKSPISLFNQIAVLQVPVAADYGDCISLRERCCCLSFFNSLFLLPSRFFLFCFVLEEGVGREGSKGRGEIYEDTVPRQVPSPLPKFQLHHWLSASSFSLIHSAWLI